MKRDYKVARRGCVTIGLLIAGAACDVARGEEICVMCYDPPAVYRCKTAAGANAQAQVHLACLQQIAADGAHGSCSIRRGLSGSECGGPLRTVSVPSVPAVIVPADQKANDVAASDAKDGAATSAEAERPAKLSADKPVKSSGDVIREAGQKTGSAVKRGWDCVTSLFRNCSSP